MLTPDEGKEYVTILKDDKRNRVKSEVEWVVHYTMDRSGQFSDRYLLCSALAYLRMRAIRVRLWT